jgi:UDP-GlcNAc:undecaprenyl-phosphate GlcNAc-1-phosphate transferase
MNLIIGAFPYFALPLAISLALVPLCKQIGFRLGIYAVENKRTVHHGKIVRIGGTAVYLAFIVSLAVLWSADDTLNGILLGGTVVFLGGLIDDIYDLKPAQKLAFEVAGALIAMSVGKIYLDQIRIFSLTISNPIAIYAISFLWIIGVTNAINLIDGLDGLSSGISFIVACTIGLLGFFMGRRDICILSLCLAGAVLGFLPYNFHPASIFMGDCGALFLGFTLACMSLLGFKTAALITLGLPMLILFIPISDTLIAIVRRKLKGQRFDVADRGHLHHILMYKLKLGHRNTVLILYVVTALFASAAIVSYFDETLGRVLVIVLLVAAELFVEYTGMINPLWHPLLSMMNKTFGWPQMKEHEDPVDSKVLEEKEEAEAKLKAEEETAAGEEKPAAEPKEEPKEETK